MEVKLLDCNIGQCIVIIEVKFLLIFEAAVGEKITKNEFCFSFQFHVSSERPVIDLQPVPGMLPSDSQDRLQYPHDSDQGEEHLENGLYHR